MKLAALVQWQNPWFPSKGRGSDSRTPLRVVNFNMTTPIRVNRAHMRGDREAHVYWEGVHGRREKSFLYGWGLDLTRLLRRNDKVYAAAVEGEIDVAGTLDWDEFGLELVFKLDPENGRDTAAVLALSIHEM